MNVKTFVVSGVVGGIVYFILGWFIYDVLFKDLYPESESTNLLFIFMGSITFGLFVSYIFNRWVVISNLTKGFLTGGTIGLFISLYMGFFMYAHEELNIQILSIDIVLGTILGACVGTSVAFVNGKMK